jgi:sodium-dependent dicarboxylate transporter 2/3/5
MILPLALGLLANLDYQQYKSTYWFVLLGIAYSANIGGIGTLVGSPPNAIAAANSGISFVQWLQYGIPAVLVMFPAALAILMWRFQPQLDVAIESHTKPAPLTPKQWLTLLVFVVTLCGWLFSKPLAGLFGVEKDFDSLVALFAIIQLAVLRLVSWKDLQQTTDWGVLILFGGGLTLSAILGSSGASEYLADVMIQGLQHAPVLVFIVALTGFVVMLTEVASNTASSALLIPLFIVVAQNFAIPPQLISVLIAIAASCAFMLPVATPPNAIVFGSGLVPQREMMKVGLVLNLVMTLLISSGIWILLAAA